MTRITDDDANSGHCAESRPVATGAMDCRDTLDALLLGLEPVAPPPEREPLLKHTILQHIKESVQKAPPYVTVRAEHGQWLAVAPGVYLKKLYDEGNARSFLLRLEPGGSMPAHHHDGDEECMVLEGEVFLGEVRASAGDYHLAPAGSSHGRVHSERGALLFIRNAAGHPYPI